MTDPSDPAEALASIRSARESVEARVATKGWSYDVRYAAVVAAMIGSQALPTGVSVLAIGLCIVVLGLMFRAETQRMGVLLLGTTPRRARWVAFGLGGIMLVTMLAVVYVKHSRPDLPLVPITAAIMAVAFVLSLGASRLWRRVYRAEMRGAVQGAGL